MVAQANRRLKAFSMVVGNNSPLTNTSSNPSLLKANRGKLNPKDDKGFQEYVAMLRELVSEVMAPPQDNAQVCECCGMRPPTHVLAAHGKELGRDWFPLAGSLGSDAQALPAGSRTPQLCSPLCLLAVQLLPLGVTLLHGKLACFQSTSWEMTQQLTEYSYHEMQAMLAATASNERLAALEAKGGTTPTTLRLLQLLEHLRVSRRMLALPAHVTMNAWLFLTRVQAQIVIYSRSQTGPWLSCGRRHGSTALKSKPHYDTKARIPSIGCSNAFAVQRDYEPLCIPQKTSRRRVRVYLRCTRHRYWACHHRRCGWQRSGILVAEHLLYGRSENALCAHAQQR